MHLPPDCFATSEVATFNGDELSVIAISDTKLAQFLNTAETLQRMRQPELEEVSRKKSNRQTKERKRPAIPTEQLSFNREKESREAEIKVEERTVVDTAILAPDGEWE